MSVDALVLFGGGIDAGAMVELHWQATREKSNLHLFYVDYGAKAAPGETAAMRYFARKYQHPMTILALPPWVFPSNPITDAPMTSDHKDDYLPGRNMLLAMVAYPSAVKFKIPQIWLGAAPLVGDSEDVKYMRQWALDMQQPFVDKFNAALVAGYGEGGPVLRAPLLCWAHKDQYVKKALETEHKLFEVTTSCYQSRTLLPCGKCAHCVFKEEMRKRVGA